MIDIRATPSIIVISHDVELIYRKIHFKIFNVFDAVIIVKITP